MTGPDPYLALFAVFGAIGVAVLARRATRGTFLGISLRHGQFYGAVFFARLFLFILPASFLVPIMGPGRVQILSRFVDSESVFFATMAMLYSLAVFFFVFAFATASSSRLRRIPTASQVFEILSHEGPTSRRLRGLAYGVTFAMLLAVAVAVLVFGARHAFAATALEGTAAGAVRHQNNVIPGVGYVRIFLQVGSAVVALLAGSAVFAERPRLRYALLIAAAVSSSFYGSKAPVLFCFVVYSIARVETQVGTGQLSYGGRSRTPKARIVALCAFVPIAIFLVVTAGFGRSFSLLEFIDYLNSRIFIGQMAGLYEQMALQLKDPAYLAHALPIDLNGESRIFHKDLMIVSEGLPVDAAIGSKVTFFSAEAHAIFGVPGILIAPLVLALQFVAFFIIIERVFRLVLGTNEAASWVAAHLSSLILTLTGGVTELLFHKLTLFVVLSTLLFGAFQKCVLAVLPFTGSGAGSPVEVAAASEDYLVTP